MHRLSSLFRAAPTPRLASRVPSLAVLLASFVAGSALVGSALVGMALATPSFVSAVTRPGQDPAPTPPPAAGSAGRFTPWTLAKPAPHPDGRPAALERASEISCARCHAEITAEWASSAHALAWASKPYQAELATMRRPASCHGCHAPQPLFLLEKDGVLPQKPAPRDVAPVTGTSEAERDRDAHFGVSCASCHEGPQGAMLGPFQVSTSAHTSVQDPRFTAEKADDLCIACHATTVGPVLGVAKEFVDTDQASKHKSCVACHMQPVERPIAAEPGKPAYESRSGRSHALQTPRDPSFLRRAFRVEAITRDGVVVLRVTNECGHRVPGLVGRVLEFEARLLDAQGTPLAGEGALVELTLDRTGPLGVDETEELEFALRAPQVRVRGRHEAPGFETPSEFLDVVIDVRP